jgi:hypothetical protein
MLMPLTTCIEIANMPGMTASVSKRAILLLLYGFLTTTSKATLEI